ncbi:hypothetical protein GCM10028799_22800 [Kribbella italica]
MDLTAAGRIENGQEIDDNIFRTEHSDDIDHPVILRKLSTKCGLMRVGQYADADNITRDPLAHR